MRNKKGFTLIELLLVVLVIGFMLAIIVPRALRTNTDAKYNLVRQNASELASYGSEWIEQQILAQDEISVATRADYLDTLVSDGTAVGTDAAVWVAAAASNNWNTNGGGLLQVPGRAMNSPAGVSNAPQPPENTVREIIEPAKVLRNPFNGADVFLDGPNDPTPSATNPIPGAIACATAVDSSTGGTFDYYAFIFQGTDSTIGGAADGLGPTGYHGGMTDGTLPGVREGVFFTKVRR
ncbi:type II secretion system protein [Thermodesulfobacteriota bacterium]